MKILLLTLRLPQQAMSRLALCSLLVFGPSAQAGDPSYWTDPATRLVWAAADNGSGISLSQAKRYCSESSVGGFRNWALPSID
jgi:hypothetical protein